MPASTDWAALLDRVRRETDGLQAEGRVSRAIPALAGAAPDAFAMAVAPVDDPAFAGGLTEGDATARFTVQSASKVFTLALAMTHLGDALWDRVGKEPSGTRFNSLVQLEWEAGLPRNPFINAGALVVADVLLEAHADPMGELLAFVRRAADSPAVDVDAEVAASERATAHTNAALAHFLKANGNLRGDVDAVLDFYVRHCALRMNVAELARAYAVFARGGLSASGERLLEARRTRRLNALMATCGFYDQAGEFAFRVGLPGKSGISGCIAAVHPGRYAVAVWSPPLNAQGNSVRGMAALDAWTTALGGSIF